jgi:hypothetical protein
MRSLFVLWSLAVFSGLVIAGNGFEEGRAAYERQEYAKAIQILRLLAEGGNGHPQVSRNLGLMMAGTLYYLERVKKTW